MLQCDSSQTCTRAVRPEPSPADLQRVLAGVSEVSRFSCLKFLGVPWGLRPRRTGPELALTFLSVLPSAHFYRVGVRIVCFRGSMATPPILYLRFAGSLAVAAQDSRPSGSLLLSCKTLSSSPSCRFIPAHKNPHLLQCRRCQALLSVLTRALRRVRHFALGEAVPYPTKARSQSVSGSELSPTHPSLRSQVRS